MGDDDIACRDEPVVWLGSAASNVNPKRGKEEMDGGGLHSGFATKAGNMSPRALKSRLKTHSPTAT